METGFWILRFLDSYVLWKNSAPLILGTAVWYRTAGDNGTGDVDEENLSAGWDLRQYGAGLGLALQGHCQQ